MRNFWQFIKLFFISAFFLSFSVISQATEKGLFWKMEASNGQVSYLFGTIHTDDNRVTDFSPSVTEALKSVDLFLMEVEPHGNPSVYLMQDANLKTMLTETELEQVKELADFHVMHLDAAMQMKPWLLAVVFDLPKPQTPFAQDNLLMRSAEDFGKLVVGIETSREHFSIIDDFAYDEQIVMLRAVLKRTQQEKEDDFEQLMAVYIDGDSEKIAMLNEKISSGMLPEDLWAKISTKLIDERNDVMAKRSIGMAKQTPIFVAVGATHLAGENGLIQAFKNAGFKLTPIND